MCKLLLSRSFSAGGMGSFLNHLQPNPTISASQVNATWTVDTGSEPHNTHRNQICATRQTRKLQNKLMCNSLTCSARPHMYPLGAKNNAPCLALHSYVRIPGHMHTSNSCEYVHCSTPHVAALALPIQRPCMLVP